jgi:hypothetical protein
MKIFAVLLFISTNSYAIFPMQSEVRSAFRKAATEEKSCSGFLKMLEGYNEKNSPLLAGYKACATMMMAKYVFNPFTKLSHFSKGRSLLEKCIAADKQNIELRFLRYTVQTKAPFFLQYRSSLKEDEAMITKSVSNLKDTELKKIIVDLLKSERIIK